MKEWFQIHKRICAGCGKEFEITGQEWAYKNFVKGKMQYYCSWKCLRSKEEEKPKKQADIKERILQALEDGLSVREICTLLDVEPMVVVKWKKRIDRNNI